MKVYIVQLNEELKIFKVQPQDEVEFLKQYKGHIIAEGDSVQEVIIQFAKLMG